MKVVMSLTPAVMAVAWLFAEFFERPFTSSSGPAKAVRPVVEAPVAELAGGGPPAR